MQGTKQHNLRNSDLKSVGVWWSCGGVVVLRSSGGVLLGMPAPSRHFSDISSTTNTTCNARQNRCANHKKAPRLRALLSQIVGYVVVMQ